MLTGNMKNNTGSVEVLQKQIELHSVQVTVNNYKCVNLYTILRDHYYIPDSVRSMHNADKKFSL